MSRTERGERDGWRLRRGVASGHPGAPSVGVRDRREYRVPLRGARGGGGRVLAVEPAPLLGEEVADGAAAGFLAEQACGARLPAPVRRAYTRYRHGPAAYKIDLAVEGGIPWSTEVCRSAGTVHLGGTAEQIADAEQAVASGRMPRRPFVLVCQQYVADPARSVGDTHPVWAYAHVPHGYDGDATDAILDRIEQYAPKVRDHVIALTARSPADLEAYNPNYIGGDILTGANSPAQTAFRPRLASDPYATGIPGIYLCSAATPPGAGVHGMCGHHAARSALRKLGLAPRAAAR
ncbi:hypothetical protein ABZ770_43375 [Streptomyces sp. NPDC006654]|uniref:phytoene desaturase family protein n=1 Tax=Streptomyces sp. NPDC006654 TaxID=3156897 RepID=UPI0033C9A6A9